MSIDVRNTFNRTLRLRAFLKGARAEKQKADTWVTWQSRGNQASHHDGITCEKELSVLFHRLFDDMAVYNVRTYGRNDPWLRDLSGTYYLKGIGEA